MVSLSWVKFFGAYNLNGIKSDAPVTASQSEEVEFKIGHSSYRWKFFKAAITDNCILGLDFIAHFKLDIKLSENALVLGKSTIPIQVSAMPAKGNYTINTASLFKKVKILPYFCLNFSLRLNSKYLSDAKFLLFEPVEYPSVDISLVLTLPGSDLPVTILNHTANIITLKNGFVLGVVSDLSDTNLAMDGMQRPAFEIRSLYAAQFRDCFPAVEPEGFSKLQLTLPEHIQDLFRRSCTHISLYQAVQLANFLTEFALIFSKGDLDLGHFKSEIRSRWSNICVGPLFILSRRHFEKKLDVGVIVEFKLEYAHPVCLERKKDGSVRYCIVMRLLNQYTVKDHFPLPGIEQCLDTLCGKHYFSTLDLAVGYWQISVCLENCHNTALITKYG